MVKDAGPSEEVRPENEKEAAKEGQQDQQVGQEIFTSVL